jgi:hypothetical protein
VLALLQLLGRPARDQLDLAHQRQAGDQLFGQSVAEVVGFLVGTDIVERHHRECAAFGARERTYGPDGTLIRRRRGHTAIRRRRGRLRLRRRGDLHPDPLQRAQDGLQPRIRVSTFEVLDVLNAGQLVLEFRRDHRRLEVHRQDVSLALADERDLLGDVMRVDRRLGHHQQQDLGALQSVDDLLAPQRCGIQGALVDPQGHSRLAQLRSQVEYQSLVVTGVTDEDLGGLRHGCPFRIAPESASLSYAFAGRLARSRAAGRGGAATRRRPGRYVNRTVPPAR